VAAGTVVNHTKATTKAIRHIVCLRVINLLFIPSAL
jgi:hypothetical protein